jgi:hypothetical protein
MAKLLTIIILKFLFAMFVHLKPLFLSAIFLGNRGSAESVSNAPHGFFDGKSVSAAFKKLESWAPVKVR